MFPEEKRLYKGVYNGIASNIDTNSVEIPKEEICDEGVDLCKTEKANKNMHKDEEAGVNITERVNAIANDRITAILSVQDDIKDLQEALENICTVMMEFVDEHNKDYGKLKNQEKELRLIGTVITRQDKAISRLEQKINKMQSWTDDSEDLKPLDGAPTSDNNEEILNLRLAIENLQRRVFELEKLNKSVVELDDRLHEVERGNFVGIPTEESSVGRLSGYHGSGEKELDIPVKLDDKGIDFFAGLKDIAKEADKDKKSDKSDEEEKVLPGHDEEEKVLPEHDEDDSEMGRPFCKVVKGKPVERKDLCEGMSETIQIMLGVYDVYDIDYTHFFKNMHRWNSFSHFEVRLTGEKMPKHEEDILLRLGNVYFASAKVNDYWLRFTSRTSVNVEKIRLIPSFFKLGKIFGAKTYPEFMDAIEVTK